MVSSHLDWPTLIAAVRVSEHPNIFTHNVLALLEAACSQGKTICYVLNRKEKNIPKIIAARVI